MKLTLKIFSNFISTLQTPSRGGETKHKPWHSLGNSLYEQTISTLKHMYRMSKYSLPNEFDEYLKIFNKGIKRKVDNVKKASGDVAAV